jgi:hypothetical protein
MCQLGGTASNRAKSATKNRFGAKPVFKALPHHTRVVLGGLACEGCLEPTLYLGLPPGLASHPRAHPEHVRPEKPIPSPSAPGALMHVREGQKVLGPSGLRA